MIHPALLWLTLRESASYEDLINFVKTADKVVTYVTHEAMVRSDRIQFPKTNTEVRARNKKVSSDRFQIITRSQRSRIESLLKALPSNQKEIPMCFNPHHFIFAQKGKKIVKVEICFECSQLKSSGACEVFIMIGLHINAATSAFGMKFDPSKIEWPKPRGRMDRVPTSK